MIFCFLQQQVATSAKTYVGGMSQQTPDWLFTLGHTFTAVASVPAHL